MTVQIQDSLNFEGTPSMLACDMKIPQHPRIREIGEGEAGEACPWVFTTNCWRRFLASWAIKEGKLYLIGVVGIYELIGNEPLFADWYSGTLRVPSGKLIRRPAIGYSSTHGCELYIEVKNGMVIQQREERHDLSSRLADFGPDAPPFIRR